MEQNTFFSFGLRAIKNRYIVKQEEESLPPTGRFAFFSCCPPTGLGLVIQFLLQHPVALEQGREKTFEPG